MLKKVTTLCLLALTFAQCNKENASSDAAQISPTSTTIQALAAPATEGYVLMGPKVASHTTQIRQALQQLGATETGGIPKLKLMFVESANPNFIATLEDMGVTVGLDFQIASPKIRTRRGAIAPFAASPTNTNPDFPLQWGLKAIAAPQAWAAGYKGQGVRVAVLDGGMYLTHPDLVANINQGLCRNFVPLTGENNPLDASFTRSPEFSHATHVAGIIAAADNSIGVVGVAPQAEIMAVKVLSDYGTGEFSWLVQGIIYAADNGADVINMSLGGIIQKGYVLDTKYVHQTINAMNDAIQYATSKGVTVICGAGNDAIDFDHTASVEVFPANAPQSVCISASSPENWYDKMLQNLPNNLDIPASYSNFGSSRIDFAAPGGDFDSQSADWYYDMIYSTSGPNGYEFTAGTSMAAPHVSGVAALIIGKNGGSMSPSQVKSILKRSADDLGKPGHDAYFGDGRVNAFKAIQ